MRRIVSLAVFVMAAVMVVWGQSQSENTVARIYTIKAKPGEAQQWEAGFERYIAWAHQQNLPDNGYTWEVSTGPDEGEYVIGQFGHAWKDFDAMEERAAKVGVAKELQATVVPYTESVVTSYYNFLPDLSVTPPDPNQPPTPLTSVTFYTLKPGGMPTVVSAIQQADVAIKKTHWAGDNNPVAWYVLANGGVGPQIVLSSGLQNMAGMQPPSTSLDAMLTGVYGKAKAEAIESSFNGQVQSTRTEILTYRPDLSYIVQAH